jgi:aspartokinase-like uncharacterized kinase
VNRLVVVKLGGGLAKEPGGLARAVAAVRQAARHGPLLIVPGGGVLADGVRAVQRDLELTPTAAHWMAILAMDQFAHAIVSVMPDALVAHDADEIRTALASGQVPVLAPYRWMLAADVLPHEWQATSDSIAAFIAGALDADRLVLLKPVAGTVDALVDPCFREVLPLGLDVVVLGREELGQLESVMRDAGRRTAG